MQNRIISEGKTKRVLKTEDEDALILEFKDDITALDGEKHSILKGKGHINSALSTELFKVLENANLPTHFLKYIGAQRMLVKKLEMLPIEVVCRNIAAGHLVKNLPIEAGRELKPPVIEFYLKNDNLHDPMLNDDHIRILGIATSEEIRSIKQITLNVNGVMKDFFSKKGLVLVDFKLEFGRDKTGNLLVGDEINCDSMRLWDEKTREVLDKDVYRKGGSLNEVAEVYRKAYRRIIGREPDRSVGE